MDHRRQCEPALRRRVGRGHHEATPEAAQRRFLEPLGIDKGPGGGGLRAQRVTGIKTVLRHPQAAEALSVFKMDDIDLWELNEAFAVQVLYCREKLGSTPPTTSSTTAAAWIDLDRPSLVTTPRRAGPATPPAQFQGCRRKAC